MPEPGFEVWLEKKYPGQPTGQSRFSNVRRIESAYGDLRVHYRRDRCAAVLADLAYSGRDREARAPNRSRIVFNPGANIWNGLVTLRGALKLYIDYLDGVAPEEAGRAQAALDLRPAPPPGWRRADPEATAAQEPAAAPKAAGAPEATPASAVAALLGDYARTLDALRACGVTRTSNVVGDYGEWLFARAFGWALADPSVKSHDATDSKGRRYQIKARRDAGRGGAQQLGIMRGLGEDGFDTLAAVIFEADFAIRLAVMIPRDVIADHAVFTHHQRGHLLTLNRGVLTDQRTQDVSQTLRAAARR